MPGSDIEQYGKPINIERDLKETNGTVGQYNVLSLIP